MKSIDNLEAENDKLVQLWASRQRSFISGSYDNIVGHHFYRRRYHLLRWDILNIIPLTQQEHEEFHRGKFTIEIKNPFRKQYLENLVRQDYKNYLLEHNMTHEDFVKECNRKLKEKIRETL